MSTSVEESCPADFSTGTTLRKHEENLMNSGIALDVKVMMTTFKSFNSMSLVLNSFFSFK